MLQKPPPLLLLLLLLLRQIGPSNYQAGGQLENERAQRTVHRAFARLCACASQHTGHQAARQFNSISFNSALHPCGCTGNAGTLKATMHVKI
jgi:hypothetical protein